MFLYCSFWGGKIHFLGFFTPFFTCFCKIYSQVSFFVQNEKKYFFLEFYQNCKKRSETDFWWGALLFLYFSFFFWQNPFFRLFFCFFLPFFVRGHFEALQKFLHPKISKINNQSVFVCWVKYFMKKPTTNIPHISFECKKWVILWANFYHFFAIPIILTNF